MYCEQYDVAYKDENIQNISILVTKHAVGQSRFYKLTDVFDVRTSSHHKIFDLYSLVKNHKNNKIPHMFGYKPTRTSDKIYTILKH